MNGDWLGVAAGEGEVACHSIGVAALVAAALAVADALAEALALGLADGFPVAEAVAELLGEDDAEEVALEPAELESEPAVAEPSASVEAWSPRLLKLTTAPTATIKNNTKTIAWAPTFLASAAALRAATERIAETDIPVVSTSEPRRAVLKAARALKISWRVAFSLRPTWAAISAADF